MNQRLRTLALPAAALLCALAFASCRRSEDTAARARIFSAEDPQGANAQAQEKLDARRLGDDGQLAERVLRMPRAEISARLGAYKAQTRVQFAWTRGGQPPPPAPAPAPAPDGGLAPTTLATEQVQLAEETSLQQAANGDFSLKLSNDHNAGYEIVWSGGEVFERGLFGPYRKRRTDRTDTNALREHALAGLATFDRLARGLKLRLVGETRLESRRAFKYTVAGSGGRMGQGDEQKLPPVQYPEPAQGQAGKALGPDPDTARRLELYEKEEPVSVSGTLLVDADTGAPLACDLQGHFKVAASRKNEPAAELDVHAVLTTSDLGREVRVKAPAFEPDPSVPHAVKDPLRFLGRTAQPGAPSTEDATEGEDDEAQPQ